MRSLAWGRISQPASMSCVATLNAFDKGRHARSMSGDRPHVTAWMTRVAAKW